MARVILSAGSNINPEQNFLRAEEILKAETGFLDSATPIITKPVGYEDQDDFLNGAFYIETDLSSESLKDYLKNLEVRLGRVKGPIKSGPRTMDLDIIVWDGHVVHEDYPEKEYTRIPVDEIAKRHGIRLES